LIYSELLGLEVKIRLKQKPIKKKLYCFSATKITLSNVPKPTTQLDDMILRFLVWKLHLVKGRIRKVSIAY
jgi:hypothetical protein